MLPFFYGTETASGIVPFPYWIMCFWKVPCQMRGLYFIVNLKKIPTVKNQWCTSELQCGSWMYLNKAVNKKTLKQFSCCNFPPPKYFPKEERKEGREESNLTKWIYGMNELKAYNRSSDSLSYFCWWGNRPEGWNSV